MTLAIGVGLLHRPHSLQECIDRDHGCLESNDEGVLCRVGTPTQVAGVGGMLCLERMTTAPGAEPWVVRCAEERSTPV